MLRNPHIGIVVVSYHNEAMTKRYVTQEFPKLTGEYTLVVVNNDASMEESRKLAVQCGLTFVDDDLQTESIEKSKGYMIWSQENLGYAKGNNKGVQFLNRIGEFSHYLFSNDDIEIKQPDTIEVLVRKMVELRNVGAIGPRVLGLDGRDQSPHDSYISPYRLIGWRLFPFLRKKSETPTENTLSFKPNSRFTYWVQGSFMLVDASVFCQVGMFDEHTFLYFEEPILAERLLAIGKKMYFYSEVEILHYEGGSTKRNKRRENIENESKYYYFWKYKGVNRVILFLLKVLS